GDGLVLVEHDIDAEAPHGRAAEAREEHPAHRIAERVAEAALEGLQLELRHVGVVIALRHLDELRTDKAAEVDRLGHRWESLEEKCHDGGTRHRRRTPALTRGTLVRLSGSLGLQDG